MAISLGPLRRMVMMQTEQRSSEGTTTSYPTSMTRRHLLLTSAPRAAAAGTPCPLDRWSPPNRSVWHLGASYCLFVKKADFDVDIYSKCRAFSRLLK